MHTALSDMNGIAAYLAPKPLVTVLGVKYLHLRVNDGTDVYVTEYGLPFTQCLMPENHWADDAWMKLHSVRLPGTSALFHVRTKEVGGHSRDIVVKWNRMGQDIPGETRAFDAANAEFNSPFLEFSLVLEMRNTHLESPGRLFTHKPLAIYVPRKYVKGEQLGRRRHKMEAIQRSHEEEIPIDWNRNYAVIYEWLKGIDAVQACREGLVDKDGMAQLVNRVQEDLQRKGFAVSDNKPQHIIVRPTADKQLVKNRSGQDAVRAGRLRTAQTDLPTRRATARQEAAGIPHSASPSIRAATGVPGGTHAGFDHGRQLRVRASGEHRRGAVGGGPRSDAVRLLPPRKMASNSAYANQCFPAGL